MAKKEIPMELSEQLNSRFLLYQQNGVLLSNEELMHYASGIERDQLSEEMRAFIEESERVAQEDLEFSMETLAEAERNRDEALKAMKEAEKSRDEALKAKEKAEGSLDGALKAKKEAEKDRAEAVKAKKEVEKGLGEAIAAKERVEGSMPDVEKMLEETLRSLEDADRQLREAEAREKELKTRHEELVAKSDLSQKEPVKEGGGRQGVRTLSFHRTLVLVLGGLIALNMLLSHISITLGGSNRDLLDLGKDAVIPLILIFGMVSAYIFGSEQRKGRSNETNH